jgi:hypothetical protein
MPIVLSRKQLGITACQISLLPTRHWLDLMVVRIPTTGRLIICGGKGVKHVTSVKPRRKAHAALNLPLKHPARSSM